MPLVVAIGAHHSLRGLLLVSAMLLALAAAAAENAPVTEREFLTLGVRDDAFPFSYRGSDGKPAGYSVELCQRIVRSLEQRRGRPVAIRYLNVTSRNRIAHLLGGNIDLECGSTTHTRARSDLGVRFTVAIFMSDIAVLAPHDAPELNSVDDLARLRPTDAPVITTVGTTAVTYLPQLRHRLGARFSIAYAADHNEAMRMLDTGQASAFVMDRALLAARLAAMDTGAQSAKPRMLQGTVSPDAVEHYGLMLRDTAADLPLKELADETLRGLMQSGEIQAIYQRWFLAPIDAPASFGAARRLTLGMEMPAALLALFRQPTDRPFEAAARAGK